MRSKLSIKSKNLPNRSNGDQYFYINDFNQVNEKDCIQYDKINEKIYLEQLKMFNQIIKKIKLTNIQMMEQPPPPNRPNNYEKLMLWKKRNERLSVEDQTVSILYLLSKNLKIKLPNMYDDGIEPYKAIKQSNEIAHQLREDKHVIAKYFIENIISNENTDISETEDFGFNFLHRETSTDNIEDDNIKMTCDYPEHHEIQEKVNYFNKFENNKINSKKKSKKKKCKSISLYPDIDENKAQLPMNMNVNVNLDSEKDNYFRSFRNSRMFIPENYNYNSNSPSAPSAPSAPPTYN